MNSRDLLRQMRHRTAKVEDVWATLARWHGRSLRRRLLRRRQRLHHLAEVAKASWARAGECLHEAARVVSSTGKVLVAGVITILLAWALPRLTTDLRRGVVRVKPFEVAKSLDESGATGKVLAERFCNKLNDIETTIKKWKSTGGRNLAGNPIRGGDQLGDIKVPGTELSIDGLEDLVLTVLGRPPTEVAGLIVSMPTAIIATLKVADNPLQQLPPHAPAAKCDAACLDALVTEMAEAFYLERLPCSLELYRYLNRQSDVSSVGFELAARRCTQSDPVFAYNIWGIFDTERGNYHAALSHLRQALELTRSEGARRKHLEAIIYSNMGNVLAMVHDCRSAAVQYDKAISADGQAAWAYSNKGRALMGSRERGAVRMYAEALKVVDSAVAPADAYAGWARLLFDKGRFNEAAGLLRGATMDDPRNKSLLYNLAYALESGERYDEAIEVYERIIDLEPQELDAYKRLAELLRSCHRLRAAHEELERALDFLDAKGRAKLTCELGDLEQRLREYPEPLSAEVAPCDLSAAVAGARSDAPSRQSWAAVETCFSPASRLQVVADKGRAGAVYSIVKLPNPSISSLSRTTDGGATWEIAPASTIGASATSQIQKIALHKPTDSLFVLSSNGAIARSSDHGATWQVVGGPSLSPFQSLDLAVGSNAGGSLYALLAGRIPCPNVGDISCARYRVFASHDMGRTWLAQGSWTLPDPTGADPTGHLWVDPFAASTLYAGVSAGEGSSSFQRSSDGGRTWDSLTVSSTVMAVAFAPLMRKTLYAAVADDCRRLLQSSDSGRRWLPADGDGLPHGTNVTALEFDGATLYAGTADGRVFATLDRAHTWLDVTKGLPGTPILSFSADGRGTLYASADGFGLYRMSAAKP